MVETGIRVRMYHNRADELRRIANGLSDDQAKQALIETAADYDRMARALEINDAFYDDVASKVG